MTGDELAGVVARLEQERAWLNAAIAGCDWRFAQLSVLEHRRAVITWVLELLDGVAV